MTTIDDWLHSTWKTQQQPQQQHRFVARKDTKRLCYIIFLKPVEILSQTCNPKFVALAPS